MIRLTKDGAELLSRLRAVSRFKDVPANRIVEKALLNLVRERGIMIARCKFTVSKVEPTPYPNAPGEVDVTMETRYDSDDPEDTRFSRYTPIGTLTFTVNNPNVVPEMVAGRVFYVDLTPAE